MSQGRVEITALQVYFKKENVCYFKVSAQNRSEQGFELTTLCCCCCCFFTCVRSFVCSPPASSPPEDGAEWHVGSSPTQRPNVIKSSPQVNPNSLSLSCARGKLPTAALTFVPLPTCHPSRTRPFFCSLCLSFLTAYLPNKLSI